jgi:hypothetical protein
LADADRVRKGHQVGVLWVENSVVLWGFVGDFWLFADGFWLTVNGFWRFIDRLIAENQGNSHVFAILKKRNLNCDNG